MKKAFLIVALLSIWFGHNVLAQQKAPELQAKKSWVSKEKEVWQKGLAAAKKRHWNRKRLTASERDYYRAFAKRVGGAAAIAALLAAGRAGKRWFERTVERRRRQRAWEEAEEARVAATEEKERVWARRAAARAEKREKVEGRLRESQRLMRMREELSLIGAAATGRLQDWLGPPDSRRWEEIEEIIDRQDYAGRTALMAAIGSIISASERSIRVDVQSLIELGANLNLQDGEGNTALMYAARRGYTRIVGDLLGGRADTEIVNDEGKTAADIARAHGFGDLAGNIDEYQPPERVTKSVTKVGPVQEKTKSELMQEQREAQALYERIQRETELERMLGSDEYNEKDALALLVQIESPNYRMDDEQLSKEAKRRLTRLRMRRKREG